MSDETTIEGQETGHQIAPVVLPEFIVTRHDSNADGASRHPAITMGIVVAENARAAKDKAYEKFSRNDYQWFEVENTKYAKRARVMAARRLPAYEVI